MSIYRLRPASFMRVGDWIDVYGAVCRVDQIQFDNDPSYSSYEVQARVLGYDNKRLNELRPSEPITLHFSGYHRVAIKHVA